MVQSQSFRNLLKYTDMIQRSRQRQVRLVHTMSTHRFMLIELTPVHVDRVDGSVRTMKGQGLYMYKVAKCKGVDACYLRDDRFMIRIMSQWGMKRLGDEEKMEKMMVTTTGMITMINNKVITVETTICQPTHTLNLETWQARVEHGQVGLAASAGESCCHKVLFVLGCGDAHDLWSQTVTRSDVKCLT